MKESGVSLRNRGSTMIKEFRTLAESGQSLELAMAFVLATSVYYAMIDFVDNVLLPPFGLIWGGRSVSSLFKSHPRQNITQRANRQHRKGTLCWSCNHRLWGGNYRGNSLPHRFYAYAICSALGKPCKRFSRGCGFGSGRAAPTLTDVISVSERAKAQPYHFR